MSESIVLIALIPSVLLSIVVVLLVRWFLTSNLKQQKLISHKEERKQILTLRLQAYERIALFTERITPESLVIREQQQGYTCQQFHSILIKSIRKEFEHNLAIQIYLSDQTWQMVKDTKEEIVKLINTCASEVQPHNPSIELAQKILERGGGSTASYLNSLMKTIKQDISNL